MSKTEAESGGQTLSFACPLQFHHPTNNWDVFHIKLESFFNAHGLQDEKTKKAVLITCLSEETYLLLQSLSVPERPDKLSFSKLVHTLDNYFKPQESYLVCRSLFYGARQQPGESIKTWAARLQELAGKCKFGTELSTVLRDIFIVGLPPGQVQDRLFEEDISTLTFRDAVKLACVKEATIQNKITLAESQSTNSIMKQELHSIRTTKQGHHHHPNMPISDRKSQFSGCRCEVCGWNHSTATCKFKNKTCNICGKIGHLATVCKFKIKYKNKSHNKKNKFRLPKNKNNFLDDQMNNLILDEFSENTSNNISEEFNIHNITNDNYEPIWIEFIVNGHNIKFEADTGAAHCYISDNLYYKYFQNVQLNKSKQSFRDYAGNKIDPVGFVYLDFTYKNRTFPQKVFVVKGGGPPLAGRIVQNQFDFKLVSSINFCAPNFNSIETICANFSNLFKDGIGTYNKSLISLPLIKDACPKYFKPRHVPLSLQSAVNKEIDRLISQEILVPVEFSDWGTPIVPVIKPDKSVRICGDFKISVNPQLKVFRFSLPKPEHLFAKIRGARHFSKLDLSNAYQQLVLDEESKKIVTISTNKGLFSYSRLPFGITSASAIFQKIIEQTLAGIDGVVVFQDDILVTGTTFVEHNERLKLVFQRLENAGLRLKKEKCKFLENKVEYLGHLIDANGIHPLNKNIVSILNSPPPTDIKTLKSFIGLVSYYSKFINSAAHIMKPLYDLTKKNVPWNWDQNCQKAFQELKFILASPPILKHFDPTLPIKLIVDASSRALSAILCHHYNNHDMPVAYASRVITNAESKMSQIEKEAAAIIFGVRKFHDYLFLQKFTLVTDHQPLTKIFGNKTGIPQYAANRLQRWALMLSSYDYDVKYVKSEQNIADFMSRSCNQSDLSCMSSEPDVSLLKFIDEQPMIPLTSKQICSSTRQDVVLSKVFKYIQFGWPHTVEASLKNYFIRKNELCIEQGCIVWGYRVIVPTKLQKFVLQELHSCHIGASKMKALARSYFWWPGLDHDIEIMVSQCSICTQFRNDPAQSQLHPWLWPRTPWSRLHLDFFGPLYNKYFLVVIDVTTKWLECFEVNSPSALSTIKILKELMSRFGIAKEIVTDNAACFTCEAFQKFLKQHNIRHLTGAPYHPKSNGAAEAAVKILKKCIIKIRKDFPTIQIHSILQKFLLQYRNTPHTTTGETPAQLMFGRPLRNTFSLLLPNVSDTVARNQVTQKNMFRGTRSCEFNKGDNVLVRNYSSNNAKWIPGVIEQRAGSSTYVVDAEQLGQCRRHVDQLLPQHNTEIKKASPVQCSVSLSPNTAIQSPTKDTVKIQTTPSRTLRRRSLLKQPDRYSP